MGDTRTVKVTRVYAGDDGVSHFEDLWIPLEENTSHPADTMVGRSIGFMAGLPATAMSWRFTPPGGDHPFHPSPGRSLQVTVQGTLQLDLGDGTSRQFSPGDFVLLDERGQGQGHQSTELAPRITINIEIPEDLDLDPFRTPPA